MKDTLHVSMSRLGMSNVDDRAATELSSAFHLEVPIAFNRRQALASLLELQSRTRRADGDTVQSTDRRMILLVM